MKFEKSIIIQNLSHFLILNATILSTSLQYNKVQLELNLRISKMQLPFFVSRLWAFGFLSFKNFGLFGSERLTRMDFDKLNCLLGSSCILYSNDFFTKKFLGKEKMCLFLVGKVCFTVLSYKHEKKNMFLRGFPIFHLNQTHDRK